MLSAAKHLNTDVETLRFPVKRGGTALRVTGVTQSNCHNSSTHNCSLRFALFERYTRILRER